MKILTYICGSFILGVFFGIGEQFATMAILALK